MIRCQKCQYSVPTNLRFCLMKNMCPSCGGALMGDREVQAVNAIKGKIMANDFAQNLSPAIVYDMALFILDEFVSADSTETTFVPTKRQGATIISPDDYEQEAQPQRAARRVSLPSPDDLDPEITDEELMRQEVEEEFADEIGSLPAEDEEHRVARLKRQAAEGGQIIQEHNASIKEKFQNIDANAKIRRPVKAELPPEEKALQHIKLKVGVAAPPRQETVQTGKTGPMVSRRDS